MYAIRSYYGIAYGEIVDITTPNGDKRTGQVLEAREEIAVVQVFEGTSEFVITSYSIHYTKLYEPLKDQQFWRRMCILWFSA